ncbi:hypothetical protein Pcinc_035837, partial [Petrolisthes cinctipes]
MTKTTTTTTTTTILFTITTLASMVLISTCSELRLVELSYTYNLDAPTTPKLRGFTYTQLQKGRNDKGIWVELGEFFSSEHSGTHLDAPSHYAYNKWSVEEIPLDRLWRVPGVAIDLSQTIEKSGHVNHILTPDDLESWEEEHGVIPDGAVVFVRTGWGDKVGDIQDYSGLDEHGSNNFPGIGMEAAQWLTKHGQTHKHTRGVLGYGVDTISVDVGNSTHYK